MATESLIIEVTEKGARVVKRNIEDIGGGARKSGDAVGFLKRMLGTLAVGATLTAAARLADVFTNFQNRLKLVTTDTRNLAAVTRELFDIANRTRQSYESTATLYSRVALSAKDLGVSQKQLLQFTESLNQAVILSGASSVEAEAAIIQLSQGMASGTLRGDELRSVLEQLPYVADVIAKHLGVTRGQLREMGHDGKITGGIILEAFKNARGELADKFAKTVPTLGQSFTILRNKVMEWIGVLDQSYGITSKLAGVITTLANNLDVVVAVLSGVGVATAVALWPKMAAGVSGVALAVRALGVAIMANPLTAMLAIVAGLIAAVTVFRDKIKLTSTGMATLGDFMRAAWESAKKLFGFLMDAAERTFGPLISRARDFFKEMDVSLAGVAYAAAGVLDWLVGGFVGSYRAILAVFKGLPAALGDLFVQAVNGAIAQVEKLVNGVVSAVNYVRDAAGMDALAEVSLGRAGNPFEGQARDLGRTVADAYLSGFEETTGARNLVEQWIERAEQIAKERAAAGGGDIGTKGGKGPATGEDEDAAKRLKKLMDAFRALESQIDPTTSAIKEFAANEKLLDTAMRAGLITAERKSQLLELMKRQYEDAMDPVAALNRELNEELRLLGLSRKEAELQVQMKSLEQQLLQAGIILNAQELEQLRSKLVLVQQETQLAEVRRDLLQETLEPLEQYNLKLQALNQLLRSGAINGKQFNDMLRDARIAYLDTQTNFMAGVERSLLKLQRDYSDAGSMIEDTIVNAFGNMEQALVSFAETGKFSFKDFVKSLLVDIGKLILRLLIMKPILDAVLAGLQSMGIGTGPTPINYGGMNAGALPGGYPGFANGGVSRGAQLAWVSEGRYDAEAHVPLPNGRSIPVEMSGNGGGDNTLDLTVQVIQGEGSGIRTEMESTAEGEKLKIILGQVAHDIAAGGDIDRTIRQTYSLRRTPSN